MKHGYRLRSLAVDELDSLADYIGSSSPASALRFLEAAQQTFEFLGTAPDIGTRLLTDRPELEGLRLWRVSGFSSYLILYRPISEGVEILRVFHASRDWEAML